MGAAARRAPCLPPCIPGQLQAGTGGEFPKARGWEGGSGDALAESSSQASRGGELRGEGTATAHMHTRTHHYTEGPGQQLPCGAG